jgi:hypothetical protein
MAARIDEEKARCVGSAMHSTKPPKRTKSKDQSKTERRGGLRSPKGGRPSRYPSKSAVTSFALTPEARRILADAAAAHDASESDIVCNLILEYGRRVKNLPPLSDAGS